MEFKDSPIDKSLAISGFFVPSIPMQSINDKFLFKAFGIIEKNLHNANFNAQKFSKEIGISRAHLHRKLKALTNQSATEFTRTIRLKYAAEMLNKNAASVSEIAYQTGFNNLSYFTRCFKEEYGVVPSGYLAKTDIYSKTPFSL
jgi:AraC-like DNA-binding protein